MERIENGVQEVAQFKVAEIRPRELVAHVLTKAKYLAVIDFALWMCDGHQDAFQVVGILHHHVGDDVDECLTLLLGKRAHHAKVNPLDAVFRQRDFLLLGRLLFTFHGIGFGFGRYGFADLLARSRFLDEYVA